MQIRSIFWCALASAGLLAGAGCKKNDSDKASVAMKGAEEDVRDKSRDVAKAEDKAGVDVAKEQAKLDSAKIDLEKARADYSAAIRARLAKIDAKLTELSAKADAKSKEAQAKLSDRRAQLAAKLDAMGTRVQANWDEFKKDVDASFDSLEHDLDEATK